MWQRHPYCSGTIRLHSSFTGRPAWGDATTNGPIVNGSRFSKLGQRVDARALPEATPWRTSAQSSHHSSLSPPKLGPSQYSHSGVPSQAPGWGWQVFSRCWLGHCLQLARCLGGDNQRSPDRADPACRFWFLAGKADKLSVKTATFVLWVVCWSKGTDYAFVHIFLLVHRTLKAHLLPWVLGTGKGSSLEIWWDEHWEHIGAMFIIPVAKQKGHWVPASPQLLLHPTSPAWLSFADTLAFPLLALERKESGGRADRWRDSGRAEACAALVQWPSESFRGSREGAT